MAGHCLDIIDKNLIVVDKSTKVYKFDFIKSEWMILNHINSLPCDANDVKIQCKLYDINHIIVPSTLNESACTAIFDIENRKWSKLKKDERNAPFNGTLDIWHGNNDGIIYFGGSKVKNGKRDEKMWKFYDLKYGWKLMDIKLPENLVQNSTKMITLHPDFCAPTY